jgi:hypothetical protein
MRGIAELGEIGGVVIDLLLRLKRIDGFILVIRHPVFLHGDAQRRVVLDAELHELLDGLVWQPDGRKREHIGLSGFQHLLHRAFLLRHGPVLDHRGAADARKPRQLMLQARRSSRSQRLGDT